MDNEFWAIGALIFGGLLALVVTVLTPTRFIMHHYDVNSCRIFAEQSGYETKFVDYNFFEWDCLAHREDGKWVSRDSLRDMQ